MTAIDDTATRRPWNDIRTIGPLLLILLGAILVSGSFVTASSKQSVGGTGTECPEEPTLALQQAGIQNPECPCPEFPELVGANGPVDCPEETTTTASTTTTTAAPTTVPATDAPTTTVDTDSGVPTPTTVETAPDGGNLPATGPDADRNVAMLAAGIACLAVGGGLLVASRRRPA